MFYIAVIKYHDKRRLKKMLISVYSFSRKSIVVGEQDSRWLKQEAETPQLNYSDSREQTGSAVNYKFSSPTSGDVLPPARFHVLKVL